MDKLITFRQTDYNMKFGVYWKVPAKDVSFKCEEGFADPLSLFLRRHTGKMHGNPTGFSKVVIELPERELVNTPWQNLWGRKPKTAEASQEILFIKNGSLANHNVFIHFMQRMNVTGDPWIIVGQIGAVFADQMRNTDLDFSVRRKAQMDADEKASVEEASLSASDK